MRLPPNKCKSLVVKGTGIGKNEPRRPATTTLRRAESVSNVAQEVQQPLSCQHACRCSMDNLHMPAPPDLKERYARSLEQQVQLLELENNFLKQGKPKIPAHAQILHRGNEVSINGKDWCRLPSFHPPIDKIIAERTKQPAEFEDRRQSHSQASRHDKEQSFDISTEPPSAVPKTSEQSRRLSTMESSRSVRIPEISLDRLKKIGSPDVEILHQLEEKTREVDALNRQIEEFRRMVKNSEERVAQLTIRLREAESDLSSRSEADVRDKKALVEETLELQRRLDDLTPALAEKEARIVRMESEKEATVQKLRSTSNELAELKLQLSEFKRSDELRNEKESSMKSEADRLREKIESCNSEIQRRQQREEELLDEISAVRRQMKENELRVNNERKVMDQITKENSRLIEENSRITTEMAKLEYDMTRLKEDSERSSSRKTYGEEEVGELRLNVKTHLTKIAILEERLKAAQERCDNLEKELNERWNSDEEYRNERSRVQKELDALQALSKSLSVENKTLREEKVTLTEKISSLKNKISSRDIQIRNLEDELMEMMKKHDEEIRKAAEGSRVNTQRALELEELSKRIRELSETIPTGSESRRTSTVTRTVELQRGSSDEEQKSESRRESIRRQDSAKHAQHRTIRTPILEEPEFSCSQFDIDSLIDFATSGRHDAIAKTKL